ncbi:MAG: zinc-binding dehydrogenase [Verrucomicrobiota bacterium]|nr:zinc-binding dehydrogenase [Verrucomicrobiota bacterium]
MKSVRLVQLGAPLEDVELPVPEIGPADVLVRVAACGICHSDAHYRAGISTIAHLPVTPGHEIAGTIEAVGSEVVAFRPGDRVCVHYLAHCGACAFCVSGHEQFCPDVQMIGKHRDGGYAEFVQVPARSVFALPDGIGFAQGAIMMCSSTTALHALNKARLKPGESVAIFGFGGLGYSALQLARALGCGAVYAVDVNPAKLASAAALGAVPISATAGDPVEQIRAATAGKGVDVSVELVGTAATMNQAVRCLGILGRAAIVALSRERLSFLPYAELINKEVEVIGVSDHLASELPALLRYAASGKLTFPESALRFVDLDEREINTALDALERSTDYVRSVIRL